MATPNEPAKHLDSISDVEDDIEQTRQQLGHTVDALKDKLDVKAHAQHKVEDVKASAAGHAHNVQDRAAHLASGVRDAATDGDGHPKPAVPIGGAAVAAAAAVTLVWLWRRR